jgi:hypothetical protein
VGRSRERVPCSRLRIGVVVTPILPIDKTALAARKQDAEQALEKLKSIICTTPESASFFESAMSKAHEAVRELEAERQALTKPLQDETKTIQAEFRPVEQAFEAIKSISKSKVSEYRTQVALQAEEARTRAIAAAQAGDTAACALALAEVSSVAEETGGSFEWSAMLVDHTAVPREWCEPSPSLFKKHCAQYRNSDTIPGVPGVVFERRAVVRAKGSK